MYLQCNGIICYSLLLHVQLLAVLRRLLVVLSRIESFVSYHQLCHNFSCSCDNFLDVLSNKNLECMPLAILNLCYFLLRLDAKWKILCYSNHFLFLFIRKKITTVEIQALHYKCFDCIQYSFWQCYISHCNFAVHV